MPVRIMLRVELVIIVRMVPTNILIVKPVIVISQEPLKEFVIR